MNPMEYAEDGRQRATKVISLRHHLALARSGVPCCHCGRPSSGLEGSLFTEVKPICSTCREARRVDASIRRQREQIAAMRARRR